MLYCKGADNVIFERTRAADAAAVQTAKEHVDAFAKDGLRTLAYAMVELPLARYQPWEQVRLEKAQGLRCTAEGGWVGGCISLLAVLVRLTSRHPPTHPTPLHLAHPTLLNFAHPTPLNLAHPTLLNLARPTPLNLARPTPSSCDPDVHSGSAGAAEPPGPSG